MNSDEVQSAIRNLLSTNLSQLMANRHRRTAEFAKIHINGGETVNSIIQATTQTTLLTIEDGQEHSGGFYEDASTATALLAIRISTIPAPEEKASQYFMRNYGSYLSLVKQYVDSRGRELLSFQVLFHFIVFVDRIIEANTTRFEFGSTYALFPVDFPSIAPVWPKACLSEDEQRQMRGYGVR